MKIFALCLAILISCGDLVFAQRLSNPDPLKAKFITSDIDNFWEAFDEAKPKFSASIFQKKYLDIGSKGVEGFMNYRIESAARLSKKVKSKQNYYEAVRPFTLRVNESIDSCLVYFKKMKELYPSAVFPDTYFIIGAINSGGTISDAGLIMGAEMFGDVNPENGPKAKIEFPALAKTVAHELIHYQQNYNENDLLAQSINEGSADFVAALISGGSLTEHYNDVYGKKRAAELWAEFESRMHKDSLKGWLYGGSGKGERPNDMGYWMGFQICSAFYAKASDKKQALHDILNIDDMDSFLKASGYANQFK